MRPKSSKSKSPAKAPAEAVVKDIRRKTRRHFSAEDKIRIVLEGLRGDDSIAELCRREGIAQSLYYTWSKEFMEAGKRRLAGDTARAATSDEVKDLRREARDLKEVVADLTLENRLLKKRMARPFCKGKNRWRFGSASTYPVSDRLIWPRWVPRGRSLIKPSVTSTTFLTRLSRPPVRPLCHLSYLHRHLERPASADRNFVRLLPPVVDMHPRAEERPRRSAPVWLPVQRPQH